MPARKKRSLRSRGPRRSRIGIRRRRIAYRSRRTTRVSRKTASVQVAKNIGSFLKDRYRTKLVYTGLIKFLPNLGSGQLYIGNVFRGNGPQQCDQTGAVGQPYGWDQLSALYNAYKVLGSKFSVMPVSINSSTLNDQAGSFQLVIVPHTSSQNLVSNGTTISDLCHADCAAYNWVNSNLDSKRNKISSYVSTAKALGVNRLNANVDDNNEAFVTTVPNVQWFWHLYGRNAVPDASSSITVQVEIVYYIEFKNQNMSPSS